MSASLLRVDGLHVSGVFGPVSFELDAGALGVVRGRSGSGRSSLLLAASGRLREADGEGRLGHVHLVRDARAVRRRTAVARVADLVDLEPRLTVEESVTERALTEGVPARDAARTVADLAERFEVELGARLLVEELTQLDRGRFALALACVRPAELIVFDDVDRGLDPGDQGRLYAALELVAATGPAVLASTTTLESVPPSAVVITLPPHAPPPAPPPATPHEPPHALPDADAEKT